LRNPGRSNQFILLNSVDRQRLDNITHCYDEYTGEPCILNYVPPATLLLLRINEFINRKKPIIVHFISYFKHVPDFQQLHVDDQVLLIKRNLRTLLPLNYALLKTPVRSKFAYTCVQTIDCRDNVNLHLVFQTLSNLFVQFVTFDPLIIKLLIVILFFSRDTSTFTNDRATYNEPKAIQNIQTLYIELLWSYMIDKWGERQAIKIYTNMIGKYLGVQIIMNQIDSMVRHDSIIECIDPLLQTVFQLT
jgi:hypothetical protein